jgi:transcriptional regulator with XRE-family HTH domain
MKKSNIETIGGRIREIRLHSSLTQKEFADAIGVARVSVNAIEIGHHLPTIETMKKINRKFGSSYKWMIDGVEDNNKDTISMLQIKVDNLEERIRELSDTNKLLREFNDVLKGK